FWFVIGILLFIIILIAIFIRGDGGEIVGIDKTYPVSISKTGPSEVPNPDSSDLSKPSLADITYKITVRYEGAADAIVVTDPLDENVSFISAEGPGNPSYDEGTHTVTWNITPGSHTIPPAS